MENSFQSSAPFTSSSLQKENLHVCKNASSLTLETENFSIYSEYYSSHPLTMLVVIACTCQVGCTKMLSCEVSNPICSPIWEEKAPLPATVGLAEPVCFPLQILILLTPGRSYVHYTTDWDCAWGLRDRMVSMATWFPGQPLNSHGAETMGLLFLYHPIEMDLHIDFHWVNFPSFQLGKSSSRCSNRD